MVTEYSKLVCQSDGTWDKSIPTCDGTLCGVPPEIRNGHLQEKMKQHYFVGDAVKYQCKFGYALQNGTNPDGTLRCLPDGLWEKSLPACGIINCGIPPSIKHGSVYYKDTDYLNRAEYTCDAGYQISSDELLECLEEGEWMPKAPTCNPVVCKQSERVQNAEISATNNTYGSILVYKCKIGFQLVGASKRECAANGSWTGKSPRCEAIRCPKPDDIDNGYSPSSNYTYGSIVRFKCNPGYAISNTSDILCSSNGTWQNPLPTCTPAKCPPPPTVKYSYLNATVDTFVFLNTVNYSCEPGYILSGAKTLKCNETLLWTPEPPICNPIKCTSPEAIENGIVRTSGLEFGRKAEYECLLNHKMIGEESRICVANKTWSGNTPKCIPLTCNELPLIDNGSIITGNLSVGAVVKYKCSTGYYLLGNRDRICLSDLTWSGIAGKCLPVLCPDPIEIPHGYRNYSKRTYKSEVTYGCNPGYKLLGKNPRVCTENKTWSGSNPKCEVAKKSCPELKIKNGRASVKTIGDRTTAFISCNYYYTLVGPNFRECFSNGSWSGSNDSFCAKDCLFAPLINHGTVEGIRTYNKNITYKCHYGYKLEGNSNRTCLANGTWSGETPKCIKNTCPEPFPIPNGKLRYFKYSFETFVIYSCNLGFKLEGNATLTCQKNGSWTPTTLPKCLEQLCPELKAPPNATLTTKKRLVGTKVYVICDEGFRLRWNSSLHCRSNLNWSGTPPACIQYACVLPNDIANGYVLVPKTSELTLQAKQFFSKTAKVSNSRLYTLGKTITYNCDPGYTLKGDASRRCVMPYKWSGKEPECVHINCPEISITNGLVDENHGRYSGATVIFKCLRNFHPRGSPVLRCSSGEWIGDSVCIPHTCPKLVVPPNAFISSLDRNIASRVTIMCLSGFENSGPSKTAVVFCLTTRHWSKATVNCKPVSCGNPPLIANGKIESGSNFTFNSTVNYECHDGYDLIGQENRTCQADRTWSGDIPTCERKSCGDPPSIPNGYHKIAEYQVTYYCNEGYNITTDPIKDCGLDGKWNISEVPVCEPNRCEYNSDASNGSLKLLAGEAGRVNSKIKISCDIGYQLRGAQILHCLPSGQWNVTWPECAPISCPEPPLIENGGVMLPETFYYGEQITYYCYDDYVMSGIALQMCQTNGTWSNELPKCVLNVCPTPVTPENGKISRISRKVGSFISYYCKGGYTINGPAKRQCLTNRTWSGVDPFCEKLKCENLTVTHGQVFIEYFSNKDDTAQYICNPGYRIKSGLPSWLTCVNGKWVGLKPSCVPRKCPNPPVVNNTIPVRGELAYNEKVIYICISGYKFLDVNFLECGPSGSYVGKMPECIKSSCGSPPGLQYATMKTDSSEEKVIVTCNRGYTIDGPTELHCLPNRTWPASYTKCVPVDCGPPRKLNRASVSLPNGTTYGAFAEYTCFTGLILVGRATSMCQMDGTWQTIDDTSCELKDCGRPLVDDHVMYIGSRFTLESLVFYKCENGYILEGASLAFCLKDGNWSNPSPKCHRKFYLVVFFYHFILCM